MSSACQTRSLSRSSSVVSFDVSTPDSKSRDNVTVAIRLRPLSEKELSRGDKEVWACKDNRVGLLERGERFIPKYAFDLVFDPTSSNTQIFAAIGRSTVIPALTGINGTIFAYGVTSSGKTHTMLGDEQDPGMVPRVVQEVFHHVQNMPGRMFNVKMAVMEIYNEVLNDLLNASGTNLAVREVGGGKGQVVVDGLLEEVVASAEQALSLIERGDANRKVGATAYNDDSSRSHTITRLCIESQQIDPETSTPIGPRSIAHLNLIDLAGSESARVTLSKGQRVEGSFINKSLLTLGTVIHKLAEGSAAHIPFRDSKLTRLLQSSLSGAGAKVSIVCNITPGSSQAEETNNTLKFASRAKQIRVAVSKNEVLDDKGTIRRLEREVAQLRAQLGAAQAAGVVDGGASSCTGSVGGSSVSALTLHMQLESARAQWQQQRVNLEQQHLAEVASMSDRLARLKETLIKSGQLAAGAAVRRQHQRQLVRSASASDLLSARSAGEQCWATEDSSPGATPRCLVHINLASKGSSRPSSPLQWPAGPASSAAATAASETACSAASEQGRMLELVLEQLEVLHSELRAREEEVQALRRKAADMLMDPFARASDSELQVQLQVLYADRQVLCDQLEELEAEVKEVRQEVAGRDDSLAQAFALMENIQANAEKLNADNGDLQRQLELLHFELAEQQALVQNLQEQLAAAAAPRLARQPSGRSSQLPQPQPQPPQPAARLSTLSSTSSLNLDSLMAPPPASTTPGRSRSSSNIPSPWSDPHTQHSGLTSPAARSRLPQLPHSPTPSRTSNSQIHTAPEPTSSNILRSTSKIPSSKSLLTSSSEEQQQQQQTPQPARRISRHTSGIPTLATTDCADHSSAPPTTSLNPLILLNSQELEAFCSSSAAAASPRTAAAMRSNESLLSALSPKSTSSSYSDFGGASPRLRSGSTSRIPTAAPAATPQRGSDAAAGGQRLRRMTDTSLDKQGSGIPGLPPRAAAVAVMAAAQPPGSSRLAVTSKAQQRGTSGSGAADCDGEQRRQLQQQLAQAQQQLAEREQQLAALQQARSAQLSAQRQLQQSCQENAALRAEVGRLEAQLEVLRGEDLQGLPTEQLDGVVQQLQEALTRARLSQQVRGLASANGGGPAALPGAKVPMSHALDLSSSTVCSAATSRECSPEREQLCGGSGDALRVAAVRAAAGLAAQCGSELDGLVVALGSDGEQEDG